MSEVTATKVLFCEEEPCWQLQTQVQLCVNLAEGGCAIVTAQSPFHPVSHLWPDHPADRGWLVSQEQSYSVIDCQTGAVELASQSLYIGKDIPIKRGEAGWVFVVVHLLKEQLELTVGEAVSLEVDKAYQQALSAGHTSGHLAAFALNKVLAANYWRKDAPRKDELGHYDFNSYAQENSVVSESGCTDIYRLGKTLRKRGLNVADMLRDLSDIESQVNRQLEQWLSGGLSVTMRCEGDKLTDSRYWQCELAEDGLAMMPCGGTHLRQISAERRICVSLQQTADQQITMVTCFQ